MPDISLPQFLDPRAAIDVLKRMDGTEAERFRNMLCGVLLPELRQILRPGFARELDRPANFAMLLAGIKISISQPRVK